MMPMCSREDSRDVRMPPRALQFCRNSGMSTSSAGYATSLLSWSSIVSPAPRSSRMQITSTGELCTKMRLVSSSLLHMAS